MITSILNNINKENKKYQFSYLSYSNIPKLIKPFKNDFKFTLLIYSVPKSKINLTKFIVEDYFVIKENINDYVYIMDKYEKGLLNLGNYIYNRNINTI